MRFFWTCFLSTLLLLSGCGDTNTPPDTASSPENNVPAGTATLKWKAAHMDKTYGFLVYRSETREGPFLRVNPSILKVEDARDNEFQFVDKDLDVGKTYYYYLDAVSNGGIKQRFSGVMSKTIEAP